MGKWGRRKGGCYKNYKKSDRRKGGCYKNYKKSGRHKGGCYPGYENSPHAGEEGPNHRPGGAQVHSQGREPLERRYQYRIVY